mgnify:CR=1 FL=1|jgi:hypothetical protein
MKKIILAISAIALFSFACNKAKVAGEQPTQTTQTTKQLRSSDDPEESFEFARSVQIFSEDGASHINAVVSAHSQEVLDNCLTEMAFVYQPLSSTPSPSTEAIEGTSVSQLAPYNAQALKISLDDENLGAYKIYAKAKNPWGRTWKYQFDFDSQKDNVQIGWNPNMAPNDKVGFTVGFKMCGLCSKNILVNSFVDASYMVANYNKPSKRLYVVLYTDFYNNYWVTFY